MQIGQCRDEESELVFAEGVPIRRDVVAVHAVWMHCWTCNADWDRQEP